MRIKPRECRLNDDDISDSIKNYKPKRKIRVSSLQHSKRCEQTEINDAKVENPIIPDIEEIWKNHRRSTSLMAIVGQYKLYEYSFDSLRSGMEVTDKTPLTTVYHS